jgi:hypothetical protein
MNLEPEAEAYESRSKHHSRTYVASRRSYLIPLKNFQSTLAFNIVAKVQ